MLYYFVKSIDQTPPLDVHISCKIFAGLIPTIFSHAFNTDSFLMFPLVDSINSRTIARFVRFSSLCSFPRISTLLDSFAFASLCSLPRTQRNMRGVDVRCAGGIVCSETKNPHVQTPHVIWDLTLSIPRCMSTKTDRSHI